MADSERVELEAVGLSDDEWRQRLSPEQYQVLRRGGTDRPFGGKYTHPGLKGVFRCSGCGAVLFSSEAQFDSGSGWPSFSSPVERTALELREDRSLLMRRTEVRCARCGGHMGHLFDDGPGPSRERWCINSTSLELDPSSGEAPSG